MTENSRIELLGRWTKAALRAVFINYFYLTLVVIGIALLLVPPILVPVRQESTPLYRASAGIGQAILVAGAVTTFMRFFASLDIVGERIQKWLTNDAYLDALVGRLCRAVYEPDKVAHLGNLTAIWRKISLAITRNAFPGIAEKMYDDALKQMLKATSDYYLDTYRRVTHVRLLADDPGFVEVEHEIQVTVVANQNNHDTKFQTRFLFDQFAKRKPEVAYFQVNGKPSVVEPQAVADDRPNVLQYVLEAPLPPGVPVQLSYAYRLRQSHLEDPFIMWTTTRYVRQARHEIYFPPEFECSYQDTSFASLLAPDAACQPGSRLVYTSRLDELLFPGSPFIFMLREKRRPANVPEH